jgi:hypothetical protein
MALKMKRSSTWISRLTINKTNNLEAVLSTRIGGKQIRANSF